MPPRSDSSTEGSVRIDGAQRTPKPAFIRSRESVTVRKTVDQTSVPESTDDQRALQPQLAAQNHPLALLDRLQELLEQLDHREAELNARIALHEHRERMFRMAQSHARAEGNRKEEELNEREARLREQARRLSFDQWGQAYLPSIP